MNEKVYKFEAVMKKVSDKNACYIDFPYDVEKEFGKKRVFVTAYFDGYEYKGSLVRMKTINHIIGITQEIRGIIGKNAGDTITVEIKERDRTDK